LAFAADSTEQQAKGHAILVHIPSQCYPAAGPEFRLLDGRHFCYAPAHLLVWEGAMAFCSACGQEIGTASFCPKCGASQGTSTAPAAAVAAASPTAGLDENVAGLLCYILGWVTGLIFLLIDKRPFVKFHAAQSIAMSIAVFVLYFVLAIFMGLLHVVHLGLLAFMLYPLLGLALFVLWIFVMYKAYQHEKFKLPIIGNLVEGMVK
jgi:uncharacterized membrane protein